MPARLISVAVEFQWDGTNWTDESENFLSASGKLEMVPPGESFLAGKQRVQQGRVTLANKALRYSIENESGPLFADIGGGKLYRKKCRVSFQEDPEAALVTVFTGYIKLPQYDYVENRVTFEFWDVGEVLKKKYSTTMLQDYLEHEVVIHYLELAGLVDGEDFISPDYADENDLIATIEPSSVVIPFSWLDDEPVLDEIVDLAQASGSRVYVDRDGRIHFERSRFWLEQTGDYTPETVDLTNAGRLNMGYDDKVFYDRIVVEYSERNAAAGPEELWKLQKAKVIQPGQTETITARFRYPAITLSAPVANESYFVTDLAGNDVSGAITLDLTPSYAQQATITVQNISDIAVMLSKMTINGVAIHGLPAEQYTIENEGDYGRDLTVRGNPYLQTRLQARVAGDFLAWWYGSLKLVFPINGMRGTPERDLGRRIVVEWRDRANEFNYSYPAIVVSNDWNISFNEDDQSIIYKQNLTALQNTFETGFDYFRADVSLLGGDDVLWY